jgi:tyrosyl-tRNA synthetase
VPLITKADGTKFGKTASGAIWLDPIQTCSYEFYQYWYSTPDADVIKFLKYFTFLPQEEIDALEEETKQYPNTAQKKLAFEMTKMIHGEAEVDKVLNASQVLFGKGDISAIDAPTFEALMKATEGKVYSSLEDTQGLIALLVENGLTQSGREARQMIKSNAVAINNNKISEETYKPNADDLLLGHYILLKKGKKYKVVKFEQA